ncbi:MAG TPA: hypothetical protein QKA14_03125 [Candidatus Megaira endosymbiont of Hartmannula sinica]|nr:hypothetical protein [Candidatus Megaera endosymbiont of Hartmannula sinica]
MQGFFAGKNLEEVLLTYYAGVDNYFYLHNNSLDHKNGIRLDKKFLFTNLMINMRNSYNRSILYFLPSLPSNIKIFSGVFFKKSFDNSNISYGTIFNIGITY